MTSAKDISQIANTMMQPQGADIHEFIQEHLNHAIQSSLDTHKLNTYTPTHALEENKDPFLDCKAESTQRKSAHTFKGTVTDT